MVEYNKDRTPIPISNKHYEAVRTVKKLSKVPMRYIVENAIEVFLEQKHPDIYKGLKEAINEEGN